MRFSFRLILLVIHLPQRIEAYILKSDILSNCDKTSTCYDDSDSSEDFVLRKQYKKNVKSTTENPGDIEMNKELLFIVIIVTTINPSYMKAYESSVCTGTMIRHDLVLTLASCILSEFKETPDPQLTKIYERPTSHLLQAHKIYVHPNYYSKDHQESKANDFCLIVVDESKQTIFPSLPNRLEEFRDIKNTCVIGGYGSSEAASIRNFQFAYLNKTEVKVFSGPGCKIRNIMCLHFDGIIPCSDDQGGPMVCNGVLYAIYTPRYNSFSAKCIDIYVTAFSTINNVKPWIDVVMNNNISTLEWLNSPWAIMTLCIIVFVITGSIYYGLVEALQRKMDPVDSQRISRRNTLRVDIKESDSGSLWSGSSTRMWMSR